MKNSICLVGPENYEREVETEETPVLLLCMPPNEAFHYILDVVEKTTRKYHQKLKVVLLKEDFIEAFKEQYQIVGTPTFLILVKGKEKKRLLGVIDEKTLADFIIYP